MLPDFLIIGAQKCGTGWLREMLRQHAEIFMPPSELHFFDKADTYRRGLGWYERHFVGADGRTIGEKTPDYLWANGRGVEGHLPDVHHNVHAALPDCRLIVMLRDPVDRAVSAVNHIIRSGRISPLPPVDFWLTGRGVRKVAGHGVIEKGFYARQLSAYLELFPREQLLILIFEEAVLEEPRRALRRVCEFLDVDPAFRFPDPEARVNAYRKSRPRLLLDYYLPPARPASAPLDRLFPPWKGRPKEETVHRLEGVYREENERLFELLGRRIPAWDRSGDGA